MREPKTPDIDKFWSIEAEAAVLGASICFPECLPKIITLLSSPDAFYKQEHQQIYVALRRLYQEVPVDAISLRTELKKANQLEAVGGVEYIAKLMDSVPSAANVEYYARIVHDRQKYRQIVASIEQMQKVLDEPIDTDEQVQKIQEISLELESGKNRDEIFDVADHATNIAVGMRDNQELIHTGYRNIDRIIGGMAPGDLVIVAARPSMGKTSLANGIALNVAKQGKAVVFFTLEMTYRALIERLECSMGKVDMSVVKGENPPQEELNKLYAAALELKELPIVIYENGLTPEKQLAFVKIQKKTKGVDVVIVDYLQLMNSGGRAENRVQEITTISKKLKRMAVQEHVPVIALSQLNRQVENRESHRPRLSDLRESGSIEQDADIVLLLHREDYYRRIENPTDFEKDGKAEVIVAKQRNGPTGVAELVFLEEYTVFGDLSNIKENF